MTNEEILKKAKPFLNKGISPFITARKIGVRPHKLYYALKQTQNGITDHKNT